MNITKDTLPARWGSALINNDWSGLDEDDTLALQTYLAANRGCRCVSMSEAWDDTYGELFQTVAEYSFLEGV